MGQISLLELLVVGLLGHLWKRFHELLLGIVDVLQLVDEQIVHGFDVFGEESHRMFPFFFAEPERGVLSPLRRYVRLLVSALTGGSPGCSCASRKRRLRTAVFASDGTAERRAGYDSHSVR